MTTLLLFLIMLADPNVLPLPMDIALYDPNGVTFVRILKCNPTSMRDYEIKYEHLRHTDYPEALRSFARCWLNTSKPGEPHYSLNGFLYLSRHWPGDPNYIPPEPPSTVGVICYTVGGKHHLYQDCSYISGKEWTPCVCDPNNICLRCAARRITDD
jgi:hypothetical protein